ncbi:MAG TPA: hypothetical protein DHW02_24835 [Ktedonobacter sp.]|nr:hypothetical protein [Ktedonobacter sp.]
MGRNQPYDSSIKGIFEEELIKYYENDNAPLARRLLWFSILLRRSQTVSLEDKQVVQERLKMYNDLLEEETARALLDAA